MTVLNDPSQPPRQRKASHRRSETRHKTEVISVRCTPEEKAEVAAWAAAHGVTTSDAMMTFFQLALLLDAREAGRDA